LTGVFDEVRKVGEFGHRAERKPEMRMRPMTGQHLPQEIET
jgi:hypothetical protein